MIHNRGFPRQTLRWSSRRPAEPPDVNRLFVSEPTDRIVTTG